jgi:hypothetical protein
MWSCSTPTTPAVVDMPGTWVQDISCTNINGLHIEGCPTAFHITQTGSTLSGTVTNDGVSGGWLSGTIMNTTASVTVVLDYLSNCPITVTGTVNGDRWSATASQTCTGLIQLPPSATPIQFVRLR